MEQTIHSRQYSFSVDSCTQVDMSRIFAENADAKMIVVANALFIRQSFLEQFKNLDFLDLAGERLCSDWGYPADQAVIEISPERVCKFRALSSVPYPIYDNGWRVRTIDGLDKCVLAREIRITLDYKPQITVNVTVVA